MLPDLSHLAHPVGSADQRVYHTKDPALVPANSPEAQVPPPIIGWEYPGGEVMPADRNIDRELGAVAVGWLAARRVYATLGLGPPSRRARFINVRLEQEMSTPPGPLARNSLMFALADSVSMAVWMILLSVTGDNENQALNAVSRFEGALVPVVTRPPARSQLYAYGDIDREGFKQAILYMVDYLQQKYPGREIPRASVRL